MRKLCFALGLLGILLQPLEAISTCEHTFRGRSSLDAKIFRELNAPYQHLLFRRGQRPPLQVHPQSLMFKFPELGLILDDLNHYWINPGYFNERWGKPPTPEEFFSFYQSRLQLLRSGFKHMIAHLMPTHSELAGQLEKRLLREVEENIQDLDRLMSREPEFLRPWVEAMSRKSQSRMTELYVLLSVESPTDFSPLLADLPQVQQRLNEVISKTRLQLKENPEQLNELKGRFPLIFNNPKTHREDLDELLTQIRNWILTKELDVVAKSGEKQIWIEVKRNRDPITLSIFLKGLGQNGPTKTYYQQLSENEQIARFLGLKDQIELRLFASGGISAHTVREIQKLDYDLLQ